ncbi:MAG TPA: hypothetical protein PKI66_05495 [Methanobacteriaceae archaeon]|nr:hypothetical protein [Methanobacteriaceae archaeon]HNS25572.1 hypothetical protein [Methanobacteriaceae archaeon]
MHPAPSPWSLASTPREKLSGWAVSRWCSYHPKWIPVQRPFRGVKKILPNFNHYQTTSTLSFTEPVATSGYRTLVYEVPDLASNQDAQEKTKKLIGAIFSTLILI